MAKALMGSLGGPSAAQLHQTAVLRRRIVDLEAELLRMNAENDRLRAAVADRSFGTSDLVPEDLLEPIGR